MSLHCRLSSLNDNSPRDDHLGRGEILNVFYRFWSRRSVHKSSHLKTASVRDNGGGGFKWGSGDTRKSQGQ